MEFGPWGLAVVSSIASFVQLLVMYGPIKRHFPVESIPPFDAHTQRLIFLRIGFPLSIQLAERRLLNGAHPHFEN